MSRYIIIYPRVTSFIVELITIVIFSIVISILLELSWNGFLLSAWCLLLDYLFEIENQYIIGIGEEGFFARNSIFPFYKRKISIDDIYSMEFKDFGFRGLILKLKTGDKLFYRVPSGNINYKKRGMLRMIEVFNEMKSELESDSKC